MHCQRASWAPMNRGRSWPWAPRLGHWLSEALSSASLGVTLDLGSSHPPQPWSMSQFQGVLMGAVWSGGHPVIQSLLSKGSVLCLAHVGHVPSHGQGSERRGGETEQPWVSTGRVEHAPQRVFAAECPLRHSRIHSFTASPSWPRLLHHSFIHCTAILGPSLGIDGAHVLAGGQGDACLWGTQARPCASVSS